jgi:hypothetical protein
MAARNTAFDGMVEGFEMDSFGAGPWLVPDEDQPEEGVDDE